MRAKGKARAVPAPGSVVIGNSSTPTSGPGGAKQAPATGRKAVLEKARAMRAALAAEVERAKVALWETTLEQGALVALGKELDKE